MRKTLLSFSLLFVSFSSLNAQKNNIEIGMGNYKFYPDNYYQLLYAPILNNFNINYSRLINKNVSLYVNYLNAPITSSALMKVNSLEEGNNGKLLERYKYHYFDIGVGYQFLHFKKHSLSINGALSLAYGTNLYYTFGVWSGGFPEHQIPPELTYFELDRIKEAYFGGALNLKYDYLFWKDRLNIGMNFGARKYLSKKNAHLEIKDPNLQHIDPNIPGGRHDFSFQINYGIHVGFNF